MTEVEKLNNKRRSIKRRSIKRRRKRSRSSNKRRRRPGRGRGAPVIIRRRAVQAEKLTTLPVSAGCAGVVQTQ